MAIAMDYKPAGQRAAWAASPLTALVVAFAAVLCLLSLPLSLPIGPMYWDAYIYYDGASRILNGQVPIVDFFAPVGPLGYYLFAGWLWLFPNGQPALMTHWALLVVTLPLMALVLQDVDGRSRGTAWALALPFLLFAILPFNTREYYPFPGSDAFGIYNRQVCQLLYVLVAALLFVRSRMRLAVLVGAVMTALFFDKITGFVAGGMICAFALVAGRLPLRAAAAVVLGFLLVLGACELLDGMVSTYVEDIWVLISNNRGVLVSRLVQSLSINIDVVGASAALFVVLAVAQRDSLVGGLHALARRPSIDMLYGFADRDLFWLAALVVSGVVFESQNTGSQAFIFLWPVLLAMVLGLSPRIPASRLATLSAVLVAATYLPLVTTTLERAARTYSGMARAMTLDTRNLKTLGSVMGRPYELERANTMLEIYPRHQDMLRDLADHAELPGPILHSDLDFQLTYLLGLNRGVDAIRELERKANVRFDTIMTFSFTNVFPYLMDRQAPLHVAIGADPFRTVPAPDAPTLEALRDVDLALMPKCPGTLANERIFSIYQAGFTRHRKIDIDPCWTAYVHPRFAPQVSQLK